MIGMHRLRAIAIVLALALTPAAAFAELAAWEQERVTTIAKDLVKSTSALYDTFYAQPRPTVASGQGKSYYRLKQMLRRIKQEARHLAAELENGKGRDETLPTYEHLIETVDYARLEVRRTFTASELLGKMTAAGDDIRRLAPYYDAKALEEK